MTDIIKHEPTATELAVAQLRSQHGLHGVLANVFDSLGGEDFILEWAEDNPGPFIKLLFAATPTMQPVSGVQGDVNLIVHHTLGPTSLDDEKDITPK